MTLQEKNLMQGEDACIEQAQGGGIHRRRARLGEIAALGVPPPILLPRSGSSTTAALRLRASNPDKPASASFRLPRRAVQFNFLPLPLSSPRSLQFSAANSRPVRRLLKTVPARALHTPPVRKLTIDHQNSPLLRAQHVSQRSHQRFQWNRRCLQQCERQHQALRSPQPSSESACRPHAVP
jgi:hypothetical protein